MSADTARRRILAVCYSQSGQASAVENQFLVPLRQAGHTVDCIALKPGSPHPFPWPFWRFIDSFPEIVTQQPVALEGWSAGSNYELVVITYPVWFLSPPPAVVSFIRSQAGRRLLHDTPVVTVTACRNMWIEAHRDMLALLQEAGARPCDHLALTDPGPPLATFVTTPRWVLTGRRDAFLGLPPAGLTQSIISGVSRYGAIVEQAIRDPGWSGEGSMLACTDAMRVDPALASSERIGKRSFRVWGRLLRACGAPGTPVRRAVLVLYVAFLLLMIITVVPLSLVIRRLIGLLAPDRVRAMASDLERQPGATAP